MTEPQILRIYLEDTMLATARAGTFNVMNQIRGAMDARGWRVEFVDIKDASPDDDEPAGFGLYHMETVPHPRRLILRRAYFYPFWQIETQPQRWRFGVARAEFDPNAVDPTTAEYFATKLRERFRGTAARYGETVLVPLQGMIRKARSFQTMSPIDMLDQVAATGRATVATLHPNEVYSPEDRAALEKLVAGYPNLSVGGKSADLLRDCAFVATQNSAIAFEGFVFGKPAVLFGQSDFHHIALNVADLGAEEALEAASTHRPFFARYLYWFLREQAVNATADDAHDQIRAAMKRGGWPI